MKSRTTVVLSLALGIACYGANVPLDQLESVIGIQIKTETESHVLTIDPNRPEPTSLREEVLDTAEKAGASQQELEAVLFNLVDRTIAAGGARGVGGPALGLIGEIGSVSVLDRVTAIALNGPSMLRDAARSASLLLATRVAPEQLPELAQQWLYGDPDKRAYGSLHHILQYRLSRLSLDEQEREQRIAAILTIFKEGLRDRTYSNRIYLDSVLEKFDPAYRSSEERRRYLLEETRSENLIVKEYADLRLRNWSTGIGADTPARGSALPKLPASVTPTADAKKDYRIGEEPMVSISMVLGAFAALGVMFWLLWRVISR